MSSKKAFGEVLWHFFIFWTKTIIMKYTQYKDCYKINSGQWWNYSLNVHCMMITIMMCPLYDELNHWNVLSLKISIKRCPQYDEPPIIINGLFFRMFPPPNKTVRVSYFAPLPPFTTPITKTLFICPNYYLKLE